GMSASFYTEKMQYAIHHIGTPLFGMLIATTSLSLLTAFLYRNDPRTCFILAGAGACFLVGGLITKFGNIPLLDAIDTWSVITPPSNWQEVAEKWYLFHSVRIAVDLAGLFLAVLSTFTRRSEWSEA
ncbi:MAG: DUF1772 domain-containing protein, partial [Pyrinomonadaceae bacterium]